MKQLEAKIAEINQAIILHLGNVRTEFSGLTEAIITEEGQQRIEIGKEFAISLNSDSDITGYHFQVGETDYSNFQNRGKKKVYFPKIELAAVFLCQNRELEDLVISAFADISNCRIEKSNSDKFDIWSEEGENNPNFDYHIFKVSYTLFLKGECLDCNE